MHTVTSYRISHSGNHFSRAVHRCIARFAGGAVAVLLAAAIVAHTAEAQVEPLGDHYIFFVDGVNVTLPGVDGVVVDDPKDASNKVMQFNNHNWGYQAFRFDPAIDMSANRNAGNVLHFRILVDPRNASSGGNNANLAIMFEDYGDDATADLPFRLRWTVPRNMRDGEWHDVSVTLPPPVWQELEDGKRNGSISGLEANWVYCGTWTPATQGVALDCMGPGSQENGQLWKEFEWNNVRAVGPFWDWGSAGGDGAPIYLDDVYIGPAGLDLGDAAGQPSAMSGIDVRADGAVNVVSWTHNPDFGGYNVYASASPITDVSAPSVAFLEAVSFEADAFEVRHQVELPHASLGSTVYYAVTSLSLLGTENPDVSNSAKEISNPDIPVSPSVVSLTEDEADALFDDISAGNVSKENFPSGAMPFVIDDMHSQIADAAVLPTDNNDLSGSVWIAYTEANDGELYIYAEVTDDMLNFASSSDSPNGAWAFDSIELGWGNYDVRDAGGSVLGGSPHNDMERGEYPDYQLRLSAHGTVASANARTFAYRGEDKVDPGNAAYASMTGGYKILALFPFSAVKAAGDASPAFPGSGEVRFFPLTISLNDRDGGSRDHQITWSLNPTVDGQWWNTPSQWQTVAMVGPMGPTSSEGSELPEVYALAQNYPNPFNPATTIHFQLPKSEHVTLRVFDVLGREVAALLDNMSFAAGEHAVRFDASGLTSGVYLYRLEAGASFVQTRRMMLVK